MSQSSQDAFAAEVSHWSDIPGWFHWREGKEEAVATFAEGSVLISASPRAADFFADGSLAWVHLDARHDFDSVAADIDAWAPKVQPGGWLSGDDYDDVLRPGVVAAVRDRLPDSYGWLTAQWRWLKP